MGWKVSAFQLEWPARALLVTARRTTHPVVDSEGRVIGLLAGRPQDIATWERLCKQAADAIEESRSRCVFTEKQRDHRRGAFPAAIVGVIHGNGTSVSKKQNTPMTSQQCLRRARVTPAMARTPRSCLTFSGWSASNAFPVSPKVSLLPGREQAFISYRCLPGVLSKDPRRLQKTFG
jgi:hypothetical protein